MSSSGNPTIVERASTLNDTSLSGATNGQLENENASLKERIAKLEVELARVKRARDKLHEIDKRKNDFLASLSHELRNPLAPIRHALYVMSQVSEGSDQARQARGVVQRQTDQLARLVDDLLEVSRINRGKVKLRCGPVELAQLVQRTAEDHRSLFAERGIDFEVAAPVGDVVVYGDSTRLVQVVGNLLQNAVRFTSKGGTVRVWVAAQGGTGSVHVRDSGVGLPPEILPRLFEPFMQGDPHLDEGAGLGLGLALVKGLVDLHRGSVSVRSAGVGKGTEFAVQLPLYNVISDEQEEEPAEEVENDTRRVLIVEDNVDAAESLQQVLELFGHAVAATYDGQEGIQIAREFQPEVVICDIGLPQMDGFEVARALRASLETPPFLIALSGYARSEDLEKAKRAGFDLHLSKPVDPRVLNEALASLSSRED